MRVSLLGRFAAIVAAFSAGVSAETIAQINGNRYLSPLANQSVTNVVGLVTASASTGIWMRSTKPDKSPATSESIFVFDRSIRNTVKVGDIISLDGDVLEYRSDSTYIYLTEITNPTNVAVTSSGNTVTPVIIGTTTNGIIGKRNLQPPTEAYTSLDNGQVFATPNNQSQISVVNPVLKPSKYGMDFWESLSGELVTVRTPVVLDVPNSFGDVWVVGDWKVSGRNGRGGLTITSNDGNPEAILIQTPLDGSKNPLDSKLGDTLGEITGVIVAAFGSYTIRPQKAVSVVKSMQPALPPVTNLVQSGGCEGITISDYNVENLTPADANRVRIGNQIVQYLQSPTILFLQEVQDNDGATDDGVVSADQTLSNLVQSIQDAGGPKYNYIDISPVDGTTGGEPGGNIRNAYLWIPTIVKLVNPNAGNATQVTKVKAGPSLSFNPGLISPNNKAFTDSRRPLVAHWTTVNGQNEFFTVNVHSTSKGGSTSLFGDPRPPVNFGVAQRTAESSVTANFILQILKKDRNAKIVAAGDWNEFKFVNPLTSFSRKSTLLDIDDVANTTPVERYTYLFGQNSQALIHFFISQAIANKSPKLDRIHINTWVNFNTRISDHDPDVALVNVCK